VRSEAPAPVKRPGGKWLMQGGRRADVVALSVGIVVLIASVLAARAPLSAPEVALFRAVNDLPEALRPFVWPLMQYGTFITIPIVCVVALAMRRYRLALALSLAGVGVYFLAKAVKLVVERPRPGGLLDAVHLRELFSPGSLGFPSGHAAVAAALIFTFAAFLGGWWLRASLALGIVVLFGRLYVGAHLPLDLVGGAALGIVCASVVVLALGPSAGGETGARTDPDEGPRRSSSPS
jgi:membrane-associated phospholipid phosphatase